MPHLTLEYSSNVIEKNDLVSLLNKCHVILADMLPTDIGGCKSRAVERTIYAIGDGKAHHAFVHADLKILRGRSDETIKEVGEKLMSIFNEYFADTFKKFHLQITMEISELTDHYFKIAS